MKYIEIKAWVQYWLYPRYDARTEKAIARGIVTRREVYKARRKWMRIPPGTQIQIYPGDHFEMVIADGSLLNVEQTQDDFSITRETGTVAYTKATSPVAKQIDNESDSLEEETTGRG